MDFLKLGVIIGFDQLGPKKFWKIFSENGYHGNKKYPNMVFGQKYPWSNRSKTWYADTTSLSEASPTWPHIFLSLCKAKNAKNDISKKKKQHEPRELDPKTHIYIWNQYNLGNGLSTCI